MKCFPKQYNNKKRMTCKRSILDILFWTVIIFVIIIGLVVVKYTWGEISTGLENSGIYEGEAKNNIDTMNSGIFSLFDGFMILIIVGIMITTVVGAYALRTTPIFYVVAILLTIIELIVAVPLANAYNDQIKVDPLLTATTSTFTLSNFVFAYLPYWVFIFNCLVCVVMYGLGRAEYG